MSSTPETRTLRFEIADIQRKLDACTKPPAWRTDADKRYFSRLVAGIKRRRRKLARLEANYTPERHTDTAV
ncbi:hypothetical protein D3C85_1064430 [compost metagenome]